MMISQELLLEMFYYKDGYLFRKYNSKKEIKYKIAGSVDKYGYSRVYVNGKYYLNHRIIYLMHYGFMPDEIDHIDGNPSNNKIENLRKCNRQQNNFNQKIKKNTISGYRNVCFDKSRNMWKVSLKLNGKNHNIGRFENLELAMLVADEARHKYYGVFAR